MSLESILIFAAAILSALLGQAMSGAAVVANVIALTLLVVFAVVLKFQGVRKPVV